MNENNAGQTDAQPRPATEEEARRVAEASRESEWSGATFVRDLFLGRFHSS